MLAIVKNVPIPTAGVALGLAALGNLLQPYTESLHALCGILAVVLIMLLGAKIILFPAMIRDDLRNSILASVSATLFMTLMQLSGYLAPLAPGPAFVLWVASVSGHLILMTWFTAHFIRAFKLSEVFPTYFICYVGIIVASATSPVFGMQAAGTVLFWFGFACYIVLLCLVTYRYAKHEIPESARPLFCIYAAPMSLSIVGYLAVSSQPNIVFVAVLLLLAQLLLGLVLTRLPHFISLPFYPSFAAMTFPFVISATALARCLELFREYGLAVPGVLDALLVVETGLATIMVVFVLTRYARFFMQHASTTKSAAARAKSRVAHASENSAN